MSHGGIHPGPTHSGMARAAAFLIALAVVGATQAAPPRSRTVRAEFMRANPCPATGATRGACPGFQVDHREALICGGKDELANLQWITIEDHKAKTRVEVKLCRPRSRTGHP